MKRALFLLALAAAVQTTAQSFVGQAAGNPFEWRITGRAMIDGGIFFSDVTPLGNGLGFTDGRIGVATRFMERWEGKVELGYSGGKVGIRDVFVAYRKGLHSLQVGHFFEPFGIEGRVGTADYRLMTPAATASVFSDRRKLGVAYVYDTRPYTFTGGLFSDADIDNLKEEDEGYTVVGKFAVRPMYEADRLMHMSASVRFSEHDRRERAVYTMQGGVPTNVLSPSVNRFLAATVSEMINQWKLGMDMILHYKRFYLQAEYMAVYLNRHPRLDNYFADGGYVQAGVLFLGEKTYRYNSAQGWVTNPAAGNLELLLRYNITDLNDTGAGIMGGKLQDITVGANYFINPFVAVRLNYVHSALDRYSSQGCRESIHYIQGRVQLNF